MFRKRPDEEYLTDILEAMQKIERYTDNISFDQFLQDTKTQDAILRNIEVIGEATKGLSTSLKKAYPSLPWREMAGMRDKVIHHYFGVNYEIVWAVVKGEIPHLLSHIEAILKALQA